MFVQAAIDAYSMTDAVSMLDMLKRVTEIDYFEIGAPLVTHYGIGALHGFGLRIPLHKLYADLKTIDFPSMEYRPWLQAGVQRLSVMAIMNNGAFYELKELMNHTPGLEVFISLMGYPPRHVRYRIDELYGIGFKNFIAHGAGVTIADAFSDMLDYCYEINRYGKDVNLIAAGGITCGNCENLRQHHPAGVIIGRGLTGASSAQAASEIARTIKETLSI
jgi:3-keto-L-gulonate-6-phosphate decarboxylase